MSTKVSDLSEDDKLYHSLGRFIVSFSNFEIISEMMVNRWLCPSENKKDPERTEIFYAIRSDASNTVNGDNIQNVFDSIFPLCIEVMKERWSENDFSILRSIRKEINLIIFERNCVLSYDGFSMRLNKPLSEDSDEEIILGNFRILLTNPGILRTVDVNLLIEKTNRLRGVILELSLMGYPTYRAKPNEKFEVRSDGSVHIK
jgi:hypothetical protein